MGTVNIIDYTTKDPITMIGRMAGICYGSDVSDQKKNKERGIDCLVTGHGRTWEFPDVYMELDGYSARVIREWYTHIGGAPTRLQASTRYIDYRDFDYVVPDIKNEAIYHEFMDHTKEYVSFLMDHGVSKEDVANMLPLGMTTKIVCKHNLRNLIDMSHQRMCTRAYKEFRQLFSDVCDALRGYSDEWQYVVDNYFMPKCEYLGRCIEKRSCGRMDKHE